LTQITWAQSKNTVIENLTFRIDSVQKLLFSEREVCTKKLQISEHSIDSLSLILQEKTKQLEHAVNVSKGLMEDVHVHQIKISELNTAIELQNSELRISKSVIRNDSLLLSSKEETIKKLTIQRDQAIESVEKVNEELKVAKNILPVEKVICESNSLSKTCTFNNYVFATSNKEPVDQWGWGYKNVRPGVYTQVFLKEGNQLKNIDNNELINSLENELVALVNGKAVQDYQKLIVSGKKPSCFSENDFNQFNLYELEITIDEKGMTIYYSFFGDRNNGCDEFWSSYTLTLEQAKRYLR
jgi:hypothetical protein